MSTLYKYPRTPHLPFSMGATSDDRYASADALAYLNSGIDLVVTEKMDGGNITMYRDAFHGRSLDSGVHMWDTRTKQVHNRIAHEIPDGWRISGESMPARRSVAYENLLGPFYVFGIWDETNSLLSFDDMSEYAGMLDLPVVPTLYRGTDFSQAVKAWEKVLDDTVSEGFVIRDAGRIAYDNFGYHVAKYVRANHVRTSADWRYKVDFEYNTFA